ncbi:MAG: Rrf2 family transcriptional regulator [Lachnospiraceae bacterium]|nr:Rrf2 family transcriptional regulator [Lachnospiraceae bacterium]
MKLSTKSRYGLKAILDIALYAGDGTVSISEISDRTKISVNYLEQLIPKLRKAELVSSIRGAWGGYKLAKSAKNISVGDILRALEGDLALVNCVNDDNLNACEVSGICVTKYVWQKVNESIINTVDNMMLSDLVEQSHSIDPEGMIVEHKLPC